MTSMRCLILLTLSVVAFAQTAAVTAEIGKTTVYEGLALSPNGKLLYVAENVAHSVAVVDIEKSSVIQRLQTDLYPYGIAVSRDGAAYVSAWGANTISVFRPKQDGQLEDAGRILVGRHPSALALDPSGFRLFVTLASADEVAIVDTRQRRVLSRLRTSPPGAPPEGTTPNAVALSEDKSRLFVAEADSNAVSVFELSAQSSGDRARRGHDRLLGRIPTDWYPTSVLWRRDQLLILTGKGRGSGPNPLGPRPSSPIEHPTQYTLGQTNGTLRIMPSAPTFAELDGLTRRVQKANGWSQANRASAYPHFKHVIYIIKENRTYDQIFGDVAEGDGDPNLVFFGREITPNHHALAKRFGVFDRFFVNAEVSSQGHMWSTAAYVTDYVEKTIPSSYSNRRGEDDEGDVDLPSTGFLWDLALKKHVSFRDYGEWFIQPGKARSKGALDRYISHDYPAFDMTIPDQRRADVWISELRAFIAKGAMPQLQVLHLPGDHTAGGRAGLCTPRACVADNDIALGRIVEALSHSPFWCDTVIFVLEDDAQDGPDHVDSHRAAFLAISAYNRPETYHRFLNTTDVVAAMEDILHLGRLSQYDYFSRPLTDIFAKVPNLTPYDAVPPTYSIDERNPSTGDAAKQSAKLDLNSPDRIDDAFFNEILWKMVKGDRIMPPTRTLAPVQLLQLAQ